VVIRRDLYPNVLKLEQRNSQSIESGRVSGRVGVGTMSGGGVSGGLGSGGNGSGFGGGGGLGCSNNADALFVDPKTH
jgi:hypothetical protein